MKALAYGVYAFNLLLELVTDWWGAGLFLSPLFMGISYAVFVMWFTYKGVSLLGPRILGRSIVSLILSLIPVINILYFRLSKNNIPQPGIVNMVAHVISVSQEEDDGKTQNSINASMNEAQNYQRPSNRPNGRSNRYIEEEEVV